jgi:hypothetical protein
MGKKRKIDARRIKLHRSYTLVEAALRLGVHKRTIENWIDKGLPCIAERRPYLILGFELRSFLEKRRSSRRQKCASGQLYCLKCRMPRNPAGWMLDYLPITLVSGNLQGICETCGSLIFRRVSLNKIRDVTAQCDVAFPQGQQRLTRRT